MEITRLLVSGIVFTATSEHILVLVCYRLMGQLPVVAVQVVLIIVAKAVNLSSFVTQFLNHELGTLDLFLQVIRHLFGNVVGHIHQLFSLTMREHVGVAVYLFVERIADGFLLSRRGCSAHTRHEP